MVIAGVFAAGVAVNLAAGVAVNPAAGVAVNLAAGVAVLLWWSGAVAAICMWAACAARRWHRSAAAGLLAAVFCAGAAWAGICFDLFPADDIAWQLDSEPRPVAVEGVVAAAPRVLPVAAADRFGTAAAPSSECLVRIDRLRCRSRWRSASGLVSVIITAAPPALEPGTRVRLFGRGLRPAAAENPGEFDLQRRSRARRCLAIVRVRSAAAIRILTPAAENPAALPARMVARIRSWAADVLATRMSAERAPLAAALLLGTRELLPREELEAFMVSGTVHLLAISGLHVGLLAAGFYRLLRAVLPSSRGALVGVALGTGFYMLLVGAETPVVRATLVVWLAALAAALDRTSPALNALAAAALVLLVCRPADVTSAGPQLSFLSTAVLIGVARIATTRPPPDPIERLIERSRPWPVRWLRRRGREVVILLGAGVAVWAVTAPLVAARFHIVSLLGIVVNVLVAPLVALALGCGIGCLAAEAVCPPVAAVCAPACDATLAVLQWLVTRSAAVPWGHVWLPSPPPWWVVGWYAWLAAACCLVPVGRLRRPATWLVIAGAWCAVGIGATAAGRICGPVPAGLRVTVAALGHGCGIVVRTPTGRTLLYDAGRFGAPAAARRAVAGILWDQGVSRIDTLVISHADTDHFNAVPGLLERFAVGEIVVAPAFLESRSACVAEVLRQAAAARVPVRLVRAGDAFAVDGHCRVRVLHAGERRFAGAHPSADTWPVVLRSADKWPVVSRSADTWPVVLRSADKWPVVLRSADNQSSVVLAVEAAGRRLLLTGDLEGRALAEFVAAGPDACDVLVAPHHGSRTSLPPDIAAATRPEWIIVSGRGGAAWGEVHDAYHEVAAAVATGGTFAGVLRTGGEGALAVTLRADRVAVERFGGGRWQPVVPATQAGAAAGRVSRKPAATRTS